jgi:hypothetical protein
MPRQINKFWWPHQVTINTRTKHSEPDKDEWVSRQKWLRENLESMYGEYLINGDTYCFTDEKDMLHFLLVWQ